MSSYLKGLALGILVGLGVAGLVLPWYVEVRGFFGPAPAAPTLDLTGFSWAVLVGLKPPFFPFPVWLRFPPKVRRRRDPEKRCVPKHRLSRTSEGKPGTGLEDLRRYAGEALSSLRYLGRRFEVLDLKVHLELGLGDAASTALVAGGLLALIRTALPLVAPGGRRRLYREVKIVPVYDRTTLSGHFLVRGRIRTVHLFAAVAKMLFQVIRMRHLSAAGRGSGIPGVFRGKIVPSRKVEVS